MIQLKSPQEIERMRTPAQIDAEVLSIVRESCVDGVSTYDLDRIAEEETLKRGGKPTFKGYRGFPASLCTSINQEVVHGIPSKKRILKSGDILGIDFGVTYDGFIGDHAMTVPIGEVSDEIEQLLRVTGGVSLQGNRSRPSGQLPRRHLSGNRGDDRRVSVRNRAGVLWSRYRPSSPRGSAGPQLCPERTGSETQTGPVSRPGTDDQSRYRTGPHPGRRLDRHHRRCQAVGPFRTHDCRHSRRAGDTDETLVAVMGVGNDCDQHHPGASRHPSSSEEGSLGGADHWSRGAGNDSPP